MKLIKYLVCGALIAGSVTALTSCKDDDDYGTPPRLFSPVVNVTSSSNNLDCKWQGIKGATKYELTLLKQTPLTDENGEPVYTEVNKVDVTASQYVFSNLDWDDRYRVDIKAVGEGIESRVYSSDAVNIPYPTKLKNVANVIDAGVRMEWTLEDADVAYFNLFIRNEDGTVTPWHRGDSAQEPATVAARADEADEPAAEYYYTVSEADKERGYCDIYGLSAATDYRAIAYAADGEYRGRRDFSTKEAEVYENPELIIDLRVNDMDSIKNEFIETLPADATVVLAGGKEYIFTDNKFSKNIKFTTGLSLSGKAIMATNGFAITGNVGRVEFTDVQITCLPSDNKSANFGGRYIFGNSAVFTADEVVFENCDISYMRGGFRLRTANQICKSITMNNCRIDYIGDYALVQTESSGTFVNSLTITNSTITNARRVIRVNKDNAGFDKVFIKNVTFDKVGDAQPVFDMGNKATQCPNLDFRIEDCIFGTAFSTASGFRYKQGNIAFVNVFVASDFAWSIKNDAVENPFPAQENLSQKSTDIWVDPASLDFTLTNPLLPCAAAGDPRWFVE